jgi:murein DD-endopeptidase MepM/ murein hydrolase activator NlpD
MTRTIKSGDTLAKIAKANGITLAQLLDANPKFKANPNKINVGDVVNIPDKQAGPTPQPTPEPSPTPQPTPTPKPAPTGFVLGTLSAKFETGGRGPGTVSTGVGDAGGVSYGSYQMTSKPSRGTVGRFVAQPDFPFRDQLGSPVPGSKEFTAAWKACAASQRDAFQECQHAFIKKTHFDPLVRKIKAEDGVDIETRSHALQDVIWSTAVQHGPGTPLVHKAFATLSVKPTDPNFDRQLIIAIYAQRGKRKADGSLALFSRNSPAVQRGVANRFKQEESDALKMLASEG